MFESKTLYLDKSAEENGH